MYLQRTKWLAAGLPGNFCTASMTVLGLKQEIKMRQHERRNLHSQAHCSLEPVALAVLDEVVHHEDAEEEHDRFEALEVQVHRLIDDPAENDEEWRNEDGDLKGAADCDTDREIHLALVCHNTSRDVLGCVAHDWDQDQTDERFRYMSGFHDAVNAVHKVFGAYGYHDGHDKKRDTCGPRRQDMFLLIFTLLLMLRIEQVVVRLQLEEEVRNV